MSNNSLHPFNSAPYEHEWGKLSITTQAEMLTLYRLYQQMVSKVDSEYSWGLLQGGYSAKFVTMYGEIREKKLENLRQFWGRKYNMMANLPKSYEVFYGRIYSIGL